MISPTEKFYPSPVCGQKTLYIVKKQGSKIIFQDPTCSIDNSDPLFVSWRPRQGNKTPIDWTINSHDMRIELPDPFSHRFGVYAHESSSTEIPLQLSGLFFTFVGGIKLT